MLDLLYFTGCYLTVSTLKILVELSLFSSVFFYVSMIIVNIFISNHPKGELMS